MLRAIAAMIKYAMRHLAKVAWVTVEVGGRLISMMKYERYSAAEPISTEETCEVAVGSTNDGLSALRELVLDYARNPEMSLSQMLRPSVNATTVAWVRALDPVMLCRVSISTDEALAAHLGGKRWIRGVVAYDTEAIAAFVAAKRRRANHQEFRAENEPTFAA